MCRSWWRCLGLADHERASAYQLSMIMGNGRKFPLPYLVFACTIATLMFPALGLGQVLCWLLVYFAYIGYRTWVTHVYHADPHRMTIGRTRIYALMVMISAACHGILLGSPAWLAIPSLPLDMKIILTTFVVLICAASVIYVAVLLPPLLVLIAFTLVPYIAVWWTIHPSVAGVILIGALVNIYLSVNNSKLLVRGIDLALVNEALNDELRLKNADLEMVSSMRARLFAVASHDLRQPMHALGLTIAQLNEFQRPENLRHSFDSLRQTSFLASEILLELMDISQIERKEYPLAIESIPVQDILSQLRVVHEVVAHRKGLALEIWDAPEVWVRSDAKLLRRILMNLVSNAIKYTVRGRVSVECTERHSGVVIEVRDTGIGIPRDRIDDIFNDRVRLASSTVVDGVGLGLYIVHQAAGLLGHKLEVLSELGTGSVFRLRLERSTALPSVQALHSPAALGLGRFIVVLDDDMYALEALEALLHRWDFRVVAGQSLQEVEEKLLPSDRPDLIIADYQLSARAHGLDAIRTLRDRGTHRLPALLLTGGVGVREREIARAADVAIAMKPILPQALLAEIQHLLQGATETSSTSA